MFSHTHAGAPVRTLGLALGDEGPDLLSPHGRPPPACSPIATRCPRIGSHRVTLTWHGLITVTASCVRLRFCACVRVCVELQAEVAASAGAWRPTQGTSWLLQGAKRPELKPHGRGVVRSCWSGA